MVTYALILIFYGSNGSNSSIVINDFNSKNLCEQAQEKVEKLSRANNSTCIRTK